MESIADKFTFQSSEIVSAVPKILQSNIWVIKNINICISDLLKNTCRFSKSQELGEQTFFK